LSDRKVSSCFKWEIIETRIVRGVPSHISKVLGEAQIPTDGGPIALASLALATHLDTYRGDPIDGEVTGRKVLARKLDMSPALLSEVLAGKHGPFRLFELAVDAERYRLAQHGSVTGLCREVHLLKRPAPSISGGWWPRMRSGVVESIQSGGLSVGWTVAVATAFCDYYQEVLDRPPNDSDNSLDKDDQVAVDYLIPELALLSTGPFGVGRESIHLLSRLVPIRPRVVAEFVQSDPLSSLGIRAFDRSIRFQNPNHDLWQAFNDATATPPELLAIKVYWLRALRRVVIRGTQRENLVPRWVVGQLEIALQGGRAYLGATESERRYALFCLAEITRSEREWSAILRKHSDEVDLVVMKPICDEIRAAGLNPGDTYDFTPARGWQLPNSAVEILDPMRVKEGGWSQKNIWRGIKPATTKLLISHLVDTLASPNAIRQRTSTDLLRSTSYRTRQAVVRTLDDLYSLEAVANGSDLCFLERCIRTIGAMGVEESVEIIENRLKKTLPRELVGASIIASGDLAFRYPESSVGLMSWVDDRVSKSDSALLSVLGIRAATSFGRDPVTFFRRLPESESLAVQGALSWSRAVSARRDSQWLAV
jgi:hypothetical protein